MHTLFLTQTFESACLVFDLASITLEGFFDVKELEEDAAKDEVVLHSSTENINGSEKVRICVPKRKYKR